MLSFTKLGTGIPHQTKKGRNCIKLTIEPDALLNVPERNLAGQVYLFRDENSTPPTYTVMAATDTTGATARRLRDMREEDRAYYFAQWLFSAEGQQAIDEATHERRIHSIHPE